MLAREQQLRLSDEVQRRYRRYGDNSAAKERVTANLQRQVCAEFGFSAAPQEGLDLLRSATALFPADKQVAAAAFYLHRNICRPCPLPLMAPLPDVELADLDGQFQQLRQLVRNTAPLTLIYAGSIT